MEEVEENMTNAKEAEPDFEATIQRIIRAQADYVRSLTDEQIDVLLLAMPPRYYDGIADKSFTSQSRNAQRGLPRPFKELAKERMRRPCADTVSGKKPRRRTMTDEQVREVRAKSTGAWGEKTAFAKEYDVSWDVINDILAGRTYVDI